FIRSTIECFQSSFSLFSDASFVRTASTSTGVRTAVPVAGAVETGTPGFASTAGAWWKILFIRSLNIPMVGDSLSEWMDEGKSRLERSCFARCQRVCRGALIRFFGLLFMYCKAVSNRPEGSIHAVEARSLCLHPSHT